jgi:MFS family permease
MAAIVAAPAGRAAQKYGHGRIVATGGAILGSGIIALRYIVSETPAYWAQYFPLMIYTGIGVGFCISTISSAATAYLPQPRFAMGSALNNTVRQVGAALGIALVSALLVSASTQGEGLTGFHRAWTITAIVITLSGFTMLALFRRPTPEQLAHAS